MTVTLVKFMRKEELIEMMKDIKNFKCNGRALRAYGRRYGESSWDREAKRHVDIRRIDYVDVLLMDEGYVRIDCLRDSKIYCLFAHNYGFKEES